jgi:iron complex outermembrane receptor protein
MHIKRAPRHVHSVSMIAILGSIWAMPVQAASSPPEAQANPGEASTPADATADAGEGSAIVVTGNRGSRARTVADSPVPIDVIGAEQLRTAPATGLKDVLGSLIPSFSQPAQGGGGTSASVRPFAIRGLSGDYLLVLVNGKRRHTTALINNLARIAGGSSPVDIDLIPVSSIGRLELLRDGAAAQYGSDAISGVLNIILDSAPQGGRLEAQAGQSWKGDGELLQQSLSWGTTIADGGFLRVSAEAKLHEPAIRSRKVGGNIYPLLANGSPDPREATHSRIIQGGYGRSNRDIIINTVVNAQIPLGDSVDLYSFNSYSHRNIKDARGGFAPNNSASLPEIYPNGFQAYRRIWEDDFQLTAGLKGTLGGWDWDLSSSYGKDNVKLGAEGTLNPSLGPSSPTEFYMGRQISTLWVNNLDVNRAFDLGLAEPLQLAIGVEHRWEKFQNEAGEPDSYRNGLYRIPCGNTPFERLYCGTYPAAGLVSFTGTTQDDAVALSRNNLAAYVDVGAQITPQWFVGVAGRAEHYDDSSGDTVSGKISTRYEITNSLAFRGGINTGFRAPSLAQQGFSTTQNTGAINALGALELFQSKFLPVAAPQAILLGAKPLKPEKSLNYTAGLTFEPSRDVRVTIDAYQIRIDDRIVKTEQLRGAAVQAILASQGFNDLAAAQYFANAIDTRTRGIDAVAEYTLRTQSLGTFRLSAAYAYNKSKILRVADNPAELDGINIILFGRQAIQDLLVSSPRDKIILTNDWSLGPIRANIRGTRYGKYIESGPIASADFAFPAKWIFDLDINYKLNDRIDLGIGSTNIFNSYPREKPEATWSQGSGVYGSFSPFGLTGGFYYARVGFSF